MKQISYLDLAKAAKAAGNDKLLNIIRLNRARVLCKEIALQAATGRA